MTPEDPRHGTLAGYCAGCHEACCRTAKNRDQKRRRLLAHQGIKLAIPAYRAQRRIGALMRLGWTTTEIAHVAGWTHRNRVRQILYGQTHGPAQWVERPTLDAISRVYDQLSMRTPPVRDGHEKSVRAKTRSTATRNGWPPPLAWDDIDNPDEQPAGWEYIPEDRAGAIRAMLERGDNRTQVERALSLNTHALMRWCHNNGLRDEYLTLAAREGDWNARGRYSRNYDEGAA